jgi:hypothetical protein
VIPEHPGLTRWLDAAPASDAVTLLTRSDGRPWKADQELLARAAIARLPGNKTETPIDTRTRRK